MPSRPPRNQRSKSQVALQEAAAKTQGDPDTAFKEADVVSEGYYGVPVITHCCMEPHGAVDAWGATSMEARISTQNVPAWPASWRGRSAFPPPTFTCIRTTSVAALAASSPDRWSVVAAQLSKSGRRSGEDVQRTPQRTRSRGCRPSATLAKVGARKMAPHRMGIELLEHRRSRRRRPPPLPYDFDIPHQRSSTSRFRPTSVRPARGVRRIIRRPRC